MINYQAPTDYQHKTVLIFGMGITGIAAAEFMLTAGAVVVLADDRDMQKIDAVQQLIARTPEQNKENIIITGPNNPCNWSQIDFAIVSPGIPKNYPEPHNIYKQINQHKIPTWLDIEIFRHLVGSRAKFIGITGTNGKSTTTSLTNHILQSGGIKSCAMGNIGKPALSTPQDLQAYVIELSSFQLELAHNLELDYAIITNITPDHLDRYKDIEHYAESKVRIFNNTKKDGSLYIGLNDDICQTIYQKHNQKLSPIYAQHQQNKNGISTENNTIVDKTNQHQEVTLPLKPNNFFNIAGNSTNISSAYAICRHMLSAEQIIEGIATFRPLPHRMEILVNNDDIQVINDSKATNCHATEFALKTLHNIYWIAGGRFKEDSIKLNINHSDIKKIFCIGESANKFAQYAKQHNIPHVMCETLENATKEAISDAQTHNTSHNAKNTVILSPACSSFDQWNNFECRGAAFREYTHNEIQKYNKFK